MTSFDCVVIGSGPGGYVAAIRAAQLGMKTTVIEKDVIGGRCLNYACIPAKAVLRVADVLGEIRSAGEFGITVGEPSIDFDAVGERRRKVIKALTGGVAGLMKKNEIDVIEGFGSLTGGTRVKVGDQVIEAKHVILATGSVKRPIPGLEFGDKVIGTEEAWQLQQLPRRLVVIGAGASGSEIASAYARLGTDVKLFEGLDRVLPSEDSDISKLAERGFKKQGIEVHTSTFSDMDEHGRDADWVVIAAGRGPDVEGLALDTAGVKLTEQGLIEVDGALRTSVPGSTRSATSFPVRRWPTRRLTRASSPSRTRRAAPPIRSFTSTSRGLPPRRSIVSAADVATTVGAHNADHDKRDNHPSTLPAPYPIGCAAMRLGVPKETAPEERRVALVPKVVKKLKTKGVDVVVERGAGERALIPDGLYAAAGARWATRGAPTWW